MNKRAKVEHSHILYMRGIKLHSPRNQNIKITSPLKLPSSIDDQLAKAASCRSCSVKLPHNQRQVLLRQVSQAESIKAAIHKLRTETPQFSELGFLPTRSKSYFLEHTPKTKKIEQKSFDMLFQKKTQRREGKYYLPELACNEVKLPDPSSRPQIQSPAQDSNVILLKRNMRYRLQKVPIFCRGQPQPDPQLNISMSGWHRSPEDDQELLRNL